MLRKRKTTNTARNPNNLPLFIFVSIIAMNVRQTRENRTHSTRVQ